MSPAPDARFAPTRWSLVQRAVDPAHPAAREALAELAAAYWQPVYFFVRRLGHDADLAQDLTQGFFCELLEKGGFAGVDRDRGKFRTYLLGAVKFYLSNQAARERAQKRGAGATPIPLDFGAAEHRYAAEPVAPGESADQLLTRMWARELVGRALERLRVALAGEGKQAYYEALRLSLDPAQPGYEDMARRLGLSVGDVTNYLHRARKRFRQCLLAEALPAAGSLAAAAAELRELL